MSVLTQIRSFFTSISSWISTSGRLEAANQTQSNNSSINCSHSVQNSIYDVFISFRGVDTRNTFVDNLYAHLIRKGIFVFKDDERLQKGDSISEQLLQAIKGSRLSIIVFSKNYASSSWCLDEMAAIADCKKDSHQTVFPVFYDVDPSDVRSQRGVYEKDFDLHRRVKFTHEPHKIQRWENAMTHLGSSVGWDVRNKPESKVIENIVQEVIKKLGHKFSGNVDDLIGIQSRVQEIENVLKLNSKNDDVSILGIWGMGGIGKTTHAAVLYDRISHKFDASCFIENVSKIYKDGGNIAVQQKILLQTLKEKNLEMCNSFEISGIVKKRLHNMKILVVLDNVDQIEQLQELAIDPELVFKGSRIIVTTRDEHILKVFGKHVMHKISLLNENEAHELFCRKAFKSEEQISNCLELIPETLRYVQCLPLAIRVLGSFLCERNATQWRDALDRLKTNPNDTIMNVLQISFDGLEYKEKEIFLHVACFFKGEREDYVKRILECCGLHPHIGIPILVEKSLITIRDQEIHMHDMFQELGRKISRSQFPEEPGLWSRLWHHEDFYHVLTTKTGTKNVKAIVLDPKENISMCNVDELSKMEDLRLLILYHHDFSGSLVSLSHMLRYLLWDGYPFASLPSNFEAFKIVELNMPNSSIKHTWKGCKNFPYLKRIDLSNSKYLIETPDFSKIPKLERLDFSGCTNLLWVHPSIGHLEKLVFLSLRNCSNLVNINFDNGSNLSSLTVLHFFGCTKLENMPDFTSAKNLKYLDFDGCASLPLVHESIGALLKLTLLSLRDCKNLANIPSTINAMTSLQTLDLSGCLKLKDLSVEKSFNSLWLESLIVLDLSFCNILEVPDAIRVLRCLERLNLQGNNFSSIPSTNSLARLAYLNLSHCHNLNTFLNISLRSDSSGGRYFKTVSGSRDDRSGLYAFDCPKLNQGGMELAWLVRLIQKPCHFRCGFDIVVHLFLPLCSQLWWWQEFDGSSIIRIKDFNVNEEWLGFAFYAVISLTPMLSRSPHCSLPWSEPHPIYLSFECEHTEECFNFPIDFKPCKSVGSDHRWLIYISREHCHFVKTGAHITFKTQPGCMIFEWGLRSIFKEDIDRLEMGLHSTFEEGIGSLKRKEVAFDRVRGVRDNVIDRGPKIRLPYNWLVTEKDEIENIEAKTKEINLSNLGL